MLRKKIKYENFLGENKEKVCYFNITKSELMSSDLFNGKEDLARKLQTISDNNDASEMTKFIKEIVRMAYGEVSEDGDEFIKSPELFKKFECTAAYNKLIDQFLTDENAFITFFQSVLPSDIQAKITDEINKEKNNIELKPKLVNNKND